MPIVSAVIATKQLGLQKHCQYGRTVLVKPEESYRKTQSASTSSNCFDASARFRGRFCVDQASRVGRLKLPWTGSSSETAYATSEQMSAPSSSPSPPPPPPPSSSSSFVDSNR
ncbi:hypothetical protein EGR_02042 [Echinococcus granulosus]|uniref:Uncharacterized protein n=1 Tax=Echinococcus granulosus TaxID=6210 RepID=W6UP04_ECHGR|nr:hypothetical protein EGR_02042 [Echinococcus granulosus]EUB62948.1 hypothetical protein EGR_02042 [Echinococcus granulosus]